MTYHGLCRRCSQRITYRPTSRMSGRWEHNATTPEAREQLRRDHHAAEPVDVRPTTGRLP